MAQDKYSALWVSHSRINDFKTCPRAYYLKYLYRNPKNGHKMKLMTPPLALGQIVHDVLDSLKELPTKERFKVSLIGKLHESWEKIEGKKGGFLDSSIEQQYKTRAEGMLLRLMKNPGPLARLAVRLKMELPYFWLSEEKNIILSGKIDWMEYLPDTDSIHIIDFKTSKNEENNESLQLPIYYILAKRCQTRHISRMSYWYLEREEECMVEKNLPDEEKILDSILESALEIQLAVKLGRFKCRQPEGGCYSCKPLELLVKGEGEFVGVNNYKEDIYVLDSASSGDNKESEIL
ncbi:MAG: PD-(D/E)XK nuclease family protein [Candidatus Roizmanbacteria bacterium]|nr:PD-(D/E)XK nuclease family protein [Candidatus Roizmanbacteria bacterium]